MKHPLDYRANQVGSESPVEFVERIEMLLSLPFLRMTVKLESHPQPDQRLNDLLYGCWGQILEFSAYERWSVFQLVVPTSQAEQFLTDLCPAAVKVTGEQQGPVPFWTDEELSQARGAVARAAIAAAAKKERRSREKAAKSGVKVRHLSLAKAAERP